MKKGEISINFVILFILGLIILAIMVYIFATNADNASSGASGCEANGGQCVNKGQQCDPGYSKSGFFGKSCKNEMVCCYPVSNSKIQNN